MSRKTVTHEHTPTYNLTWEQMEQLKSEGRDEAFQMMIGFPLLILRDKYKFGATRLEKFVDQMGDLYDSMTKKYLTFPDMINALEEETGIKLRRER